MVTPAVAVGVVIIVCYGWAVLCCARLCMLWQLPLLFGIPVEGDKESWWDSGERKTVAY